MSNKKSYILKFNTCEINLFDTYEMESRRNKLMSLYSFLLKISEFGAVKISFSSLLKRYNKGHKKYKMALTTLKDAIKTLMDLGLLKVIDKVRSINVYSFLRFNFKYFYGTNPTEIRPENPTCGKVSKSIENSEFSVDTACPKVISVKIDKDLDIKSNTLKSYTEFIKSKEKIKDIKIIINHAKQLFKSFNIKNTFVKETVIGRLKKYYKNITIEFLDNYIIQTIESVKSNIKSYKTKISQKKKDDKCKKLKFNNLNQINYNYSEVEACLLGQKSYDEVKDNLINKENPIIEPKNYNQNNFKFNNFEARTYDYDSLEKQLLGWE